LKQKKDIIHCIHCSLFFGQVRVYNIIKQFSGGSLRANNDKLIIATKEFLTIKLSKNLKGRNQFEFAFYFIYDDTGYKGGRNILNILN
jgi:hypothetical protein